MPPPTCIDLAQEDERPVLDNLMQLYIHDFSELFAGTDRGDMEPDGRFAHDLLAPYWSAPDHLPLLLRIDARPVGFALINATPHSGRPVDRTVAEFFIARKHRRTGAGTAAAQAIFRRYPGAWEVAVARKNVASQAFWRRTVAACPGVTDVEDTDCNSAEWDGPILRFRIVA